jgi:hypothetical protein
MIHGIVVRLTFRLTEHSIPKSICVQIRYILSVACQTSKAILMHERLIGRVETGYFIKNIRKELYTCNFSFKTKEERHFSHVHLFVAGYNCLS